MDDIEISTPPNWIMSSVDIVGSVQLGRQRSPDKVTGQYSTKYLRAANITFDGLDLEDVLEMDFTPQERDIYKLQREDIVLAEASGSAASVGRAALWQDEMEICCFQNTVIRFRPHAVDPRFAMVVFRYFAVTGIFARTSRGSGILHLGATRFRSLPFPLPPLAEQLRIAKQVEIRSRKARQAKSALESILANITTRNEDILFAAANGTLVEPESHVAFREKRKYENAREMLARVTANANGILTDSDPPSNPRFGQLPEGWAWKLIAQVGQVAIGRQRSPKNEEGPDLRPYLRVANVYEDHIDTSDVLSMNFTSSEYDTYALKWGDILLNEGQSPELVGRPAIYRDDIPGACYQNSLLRFRASRAVAPEFALLVFRYYLHAGIFKESARWTTNIAHLSLHRFSEIPFPLPPLAEQQRIVEEAHRRLRETKNDEVSARLSLDRLPDEEFELLTAAIQGKLVPQDPRDEPATVYLERIGPATTPPRLSRAAPSKTSSGASKQEGTVATDLGVQDAASPFPQTPLAKVLSSAGRPLSAAELYARARYDRDSTAHVEHFYLTLRQELGRSITVISGPEGDILLEVSSNAAD